MKGYFKTLGISLIPTILMFIGKSDSVFVWLTDNNYITNQIDIPQTQLWFFFIGIFWAGLITPAQLANKKSQLDDLQKSYNDLMVFYKETYFNTIREDIKKYNKNFRTRIFVPDNGWKSYLSDKIEFVLKEFNGISDPLNVKYLNFQISPVCQGLVGKACTEKAIIIDCNIDPDNYNLTHYQKSKTSDVKFCSTAPIFNKDNKVVAVLAVDSNDLVPLNEEEVQKWKNHIIYYCAFVDKQLNFK